MLAEMRKRGWRLDWMRDEWRGPHASTERIGGLEALL